MAELTNIPDATDEDLLPLGDDEDLKPLAVEDATDEDLLPLAPAEQPAQGSIVGDVARGVGGQVKEMVTHNPLQTIGGMLWGAAKGGAAALTVPAEAIQTIMFASPAKVLKNLPALDTQALRDAGWDEPRIEHMLDQRNKVANSLMEDMDAGEKKVREDTANGIGFYLSLLAGGLAGKGGAALAGRLGAKGLAAKALSHIPAGSAGLGTFSGTAAAVRGETPREVAVQAGTGAVLGGLMGSVPLAGDIPIVKRQLARAGEAMGHGVSPEGAPLTPEQAARATAIENKAGVVKDQREALEKFHPEELEAFDKLEGGKFPPPAEGLAKPAAPAAPAEPAGPPLSAAEARTAHPVVQKLTKVLKDAKPLLKNQKEINKEQRSARLGASKAARDAAGGGEAGAKAARAALKSPFPKAEFTGVRESFQQAEIETLHKMIVDTPLTGYETIRAEGALAKILGINAEGKGLVAGVPNASELVLLREVFGKDFVQAALDKRTLMGKIGHEVASVLNVPRAIMTSFDMSAPGRQGFLLSTTPQFWQNLAPMVKAWGSNKFYDAGMKEMRARPEWEAYKRADGAFTDVNGMLGPMEEAFATRLTNKIPIVGRSGRAHTFFLNRLRLDTFRRLLEDAKKAGIADPLKDKAFIESATHYVNTATGRGRLPGKLQRSAEALNTVFFSPRLLMSRAETFNPKYYASLSPVVRAAAIRNNLSAAVAATTAASLAAMIPGVTVGLNPLEADFMKVREGYTRFDLYGGHLQLIRAAAQLADITVSGARGEKPHFGNPRYPATAWDVTERFIENKTSPVASFVLIMLKGKGRDNKPIQWDKEVASRLISLMVQDTYDVVVERGITPTSAAAAAAAFIGGGTQTYGSPVTRQKNPFDIVKEGIETFGLPTIEYKTANGKNARGIVPREHAEQYTKEVQEAEGKALAMLVSNPGFIVATPEKQETILKKVVTAYRTQVKMKWVNANKAAFSKGASSNASIRLVPPPAGPEAPVTIPPDEE